ncbi:MAG: hypothetical protein KGO94_03595 [Alphaproteobacteria bacterium]|nr:hypothetical protein [Alphaproteobacteria bacterium]
MTRGALLLLAFVLGGCASSMPLSKEAPLPVPQDALVRPPWEAYVKAGPGAENDVDLETLNGPQVAAAPPIPSVPENTPSAEPPPETVKMVPPPKGNTVQIKAVAVLPVLGSTPKGNGELRAALRKVLQDAGWEVISSARKDALTIQGKVAIDPALAGKQMVHLQWLVATPQGKTLGDIKQDNAVPDGALASGWGENAGFAAQGAADGIFKLIEKYR